VFSVIATLHGSAFASASGTPSFFDSFSKYWKMHWFYIYFGRPHWATLDHPRKRQKSQNERHAAWERFSKMQNERRAAWERVFGRDGPDWSPQKGPQKASQTVYFKLLLTFSGAPLKHLSCAHQKMEQPKWAPKSAHSECSKYVFFRRCLINVVFRLRFWRAILFRFVFKICKKALVLYIFRMSSLRPCWTTQGNVKNPKTSPRLHGNAPTQEGTNATLHGNAFRLNWGPQSGPLQIAQTIYFKRFGALCRQNGKL